MSLFYLIFSKIDYVQCDQPIVKQTTHKLMQKDMYDSIVSSAQHFRDDTDVIIQDTAGNITTSVLRNCIPVELLHELYRDILQYDKYGYQQRKDARATECTLRLGYYVERGGQGRLLHSKLQEHHGKEISTKHNKLWNLLSNICQLHDPEYYDFIGQIPTSYRPFGIFSQMFCNILPPKAAHRDNKDVKWCFVFYCGDFTETYLHLYYQNIYVHCKIGDLIILNSKQIWHKADTETANKVSVILTTHKAVVNRFLNK